MFISFGIVVVKEGDGGGEGEGERGEGSGEGGRGTEKNAPFQDDPSPLKINFFRQIFCTLSIFYDSERLNSES